MLRLLKRLRRHRGELFVFLYHAGVPSNNNHAERVIRNGVVMRKGLRINNLSNFPLFFHGVIPFAVKVVRF